MSRILIIEDQPDVRKLIRMTLEMEPHDIREARTGEEGLAMARQHQPDVVLLDVMMPGPVNGLSVCRALRADPVLRRAKIAMLSARSHSKDQEAGMQAGADCYLVKPFSPLALIKVLHQLTERP